MVSFKILDSISDYNVWLEIFNNWKGKEPFAHPTYCSLFCDDKSSAHCAILESDFGSIIFPFLIREIAKEPYGLGLNYKDIISPYGYGGRYILSFGSSKEKLLECFDENFKTFLLSENIISEVIKFHLFEDELLPYSENVEIVNNNIVINLNQSFDQFLLNAEHKVRKNVKKAKRSNLYVINDESGLHINSFKDIYYSTMERRNANNNYYFDDLFFSRLIEEMKGCYQFFHVMLDDKIISSELCLISEKYIYSFLGGTIDEFFELRPNDLLKIEIVNWGILNKKQAFVLGGGYLIDDGIFKYKKAFAPDGVYDFKIGTSIIDQNKYNEVVNSKVNYYNSVLNETWVPNIHYIPSYRI